MRGGCTVPRFAAEHYAPLVCQCAILRRLAEYSAQLARDAAEGSLSPDGAEELLTTAEYDLQQIASRQIRPREKGWRQTLAEELYRLEHRQGQGIPTGFATLDRRYGGFAARELTFLAARTSRGKTQLADAIFPTSLMRSGERCSCGRYCQPSSG
jgi:replicative DNA helicase